MSRCNVIVVGASAGGVGSLTRLVSRLPADLPAAIAVALHVPENSPSVLPAILTRERTLPAVHPSDGDPLLHGRIYVAPPGRHLLIKRARVRVVNGPHENGHRPAVDPLFRTAARAHGRRTIGVILSGSLDDGTAGAAAVHAEGGVTLVQDPAEAMFSGMPTSAIENAEVDFVGGVDALADELVRRVTALAVDEEQSIMSNDGDEQIDAVEMDRGAPDPDSWPAAPSEFTCPECHGSLFELREGEVVRFRCRTGHAYGSETLASEQAHKIEEALWIALRALEENIALIRRLHERARARGQTRAALRFVEQARAVDERAKVIRAALLSSGATVS